MYLIYFVFAKNRHIFSNSNKLHFLRNINKYQHNLTGNIVALKICPQVNQWMFTRIHNSSVIHIQNRKRPFFYLIFYGIKNSVYSPLPIVWFLARLLASAAIDSLWPATLHKKQIQVSPWHTTGHLITIQNSSRHPSPPKDTYNPVPKF